MKNAISPEEAARLIPDGASILFGGFLAVGSPERLFLQPISKVSLGVHGV